MRAYELSAAGYYFIKKEGGCRAPDQIKKGGNRNYKEIKYAAEKKSGAPESKAHDITHNAAILEEGLSKILKSYPKGKKTVKFF